MVNLELKAYLASKGMTMKEFSVLSGYQYQYLINATTNCRMSDELHKRLIELTEGKVNFNLKKCPTCGRLESRSKKPKDISQAPAPENSGSNDIAADFFDKHNRVK